VPVRTVKERAALRRIGNAIVKRRILSETTQENVAEHAGISVQFLRRVEHGTGNPSYLTMLSVARALGLQLVDLVREAE